MGTRVSAVGDAVYKQGVSEQEAFALQRMTVGNSQRLPHVINMHGAGKNRYNVLMTNKGRSLDSLPSTEWAHRPREFRLDMTRALKELRDAGYEHKDLEARNITWDGKNFNLVDLGKLRRMTKSERSAPNWVAEHEFVAEKLWKKVSTQAGKPRKRAREPTTSE